MTSPTATLRVSGEGSNSQSAPSRAKTPIPATVTKRCEAFYPHIGADSPTHGSERAANGGCQDGFIVGSVINYIQ